MGMRVEAVWKPDGEREGSHEDILLLPSDRRARRAAASRSSIDYERAPQRRRRRLHAAPRRRAGRAPHRDRDALPGGARRARASAASSATRSTTRSPASTDYIDGRPFGFVAALDVMGSWPPRQDLHLEMDGSFAAYYAWLKIQTGESTRPSCAATARPRRASRERVLNLQLDPYYHAPARTRADHDLGAAGERLHGAHAARPTATLAEIAARNRDRRGTQSRRAGTRRRGGRRACSARRWAAEPLRRGYLPPIGETATCLVLAAEGKAETMCDRPAWIHGRRSSDRAADPRGARPLAQRERQARRRAGVRHGRARRARATSTWSSCMATTPVEELILCDALGLDPAAATPALNPSGGALGGASAS